MNTTPNSPVFDKPLTPKIAVLGIGGAGSNAVNNMIVSDLEGADFAVCNTDAQALDQSLADVKIQLGPTVTKGLGAGSDPNVGRSAAEESVEEVLSHLDGVNMAFITAGMGGGTGTGAAPIIARAVRERGILTVGVVTKPFQFEGAHRMRMAEQGVEQLQDVVDTLIVIPNQNLFRIANQNTTFAQAFELADSVLQAGVRNVTDLIVKNGLINLDFADVRCAMMEMGKAMMGTGEASGERKAIEAAEAAINNPLLDDVSMKGARGVIINITGGYDMTLFDVDEACNRIRDEVDSDANIIFGSTFDDSMEGVMRVSIVATGIEAESVRRNKPFSSGNGIVQGNTAPRESLPQSNEGVAQASSMPAAPAQGRVISQGIPQTVQPAAHVAAAPAAAAFSAPQAVTAHQSTPQPAASAPATPAYAAAPAQVSAPSFPPAPTAARMGSTNAALAVEEPVAAPRPLPAETDFRAPQRPIEPQAQESAYEGFMKKPMSLFDRFKGGSHDAQAHEGGVQQPMATTPAPVSQPVQPTAPSQPQLEIETPQQPEKDVKDNLDIPAFLRRQAS